MSRASPLIRALPRSTVRPAIRTYHASQSVQAATAQAPSSRPTTPRRVAVPASAARISRAPVKPVASAPSQTRPVSAAAEDDFDFPMPNVDPIDGYAQLAPGQSSAPSPSVARASASAPAPSTSTTPPSRNISGSSSSFGDVTPSPPLTNFPNDGYRPLPTTAAGEGVGLGDTTSDWSTSFSGLSQQPFDREVAEALLKPLQVADIELKPGTHFIRYLHSLVWR